MQVHCSLLTISKQFFFCASAVLFQVSGNDGGTSRSFVDGNVVNQNIQSAVQGTYCQIRHSPAEANPRSFVRKKKVFLLFTALQKQPCCQPFLVGCSVCQARMLSLMLACCDRSLPSRLANRLIQVFRLTLWQALLAIVVIMALLESA